jgi:hypothetical protein
MYQARGDGIRGRSRRQGMRGARRQEGREQDSKEQLTVTGNPETRCSKSAIPWYTGIYDAMNHSLVFLSFYVWHLLHDARRSFCKVEG